MWTKTTEETPPAGWYWVVKQNPVTKKQWYDLAPCWKLGGKLGFHTAMVTHYQTPDPLPEPVCIY